MRQIAQSQALVQAILSIAAGGVNIAGVITAVSHDSIHIGGPGYELILNPHEILTISTETPFDSSSPAVARMAERMKCVYDIKLANGDRVAIYELIENRPAQH